MSFPAASDNVQSRENVLASGPLTAPASTGPAIVYICTNEVSTSCPGLLSSPLTYCSLVDAYRVKPFLAIYHVEPTSTYQLPHGDIVLERPRTGLLG
jgi:hypothetical protein